MTPKSKNPNNRRRIEEAVTGQTDPFCADEDDMDLGLDIDSDDFAIDSVDGVLFGEPSNEDLNVIEIDTEDWEV